MAWKITIQSAKPNPQGKDVVGGYPLAQQLLGEWADLKNVGDASVTLSVIHLAHLEFSAACVAKEAPSLYWNGSPGVTLNVGETVRVHTGRSTDAAKMAMADWKGANHHAYAELGNFVLNNRCGDKLYVYWKDGNGKWHLEDSAYYDPNPPEGAVLQRVGDKLTPSVFSFGGFV